MAGVLLEIIAFVGGPIAASITAVIVVMTNVERAERAWGRFLGLFSWLSTGLRRRSIQNTIKGEIDTFSKSVNGEVRGLMPYNVKLDFVKEIDQAELVVLREFQDFAVNIGTRYPGQDYVSEAKGFVNYVDSVAKRPPGETMGTPGFRGAHIATAFVLIGEQARIATEGAVPYLRHLEYLRGQRFERGLLAARGAERMDMAQRVSHLAEKKGIAKRVSSTTYQTTGASGQARDTCLIEMRIIPR